MIDLRTSRILALFTAAICGCYESAGVFGTDGDPAGDADSDSDSDSDGDTGSDTGTGDACASGYYDGVDLLVMMDDSRSMTLDGAVVESGFFALVRALLDPPEGSPYAAVGAMRFAVVTSNMGVSYGEGVAVPDGEITPPDLRLSTAHCLNRGDVGEFQRDGAGSVVMEGAEVDCPENDAGVLDTGPTQDDAFGLRTACLTQQGTGGCGLEQQLQSAAVALMREDQQSFLVDTHVLAVLVVTDEEDCSMADAPGLFATDEAQDPHRLNVACNVDAQNESFLFPVARFADVFIDAKGNPDAVVFAAIIGVPRPGEGPAGAAACEGRGDALDGCLERADMQMVPYEGEIDGVPAQLFTPTCLRFASDGDVVSAVPGRRFVRLAAEQFGARGYVSSYCEADWTPAMEAIAELIGERIEEACP
jgi:hypothetical protein